MPTLRFQDSLFALVSAVITASLFVDAAIPLAPIA